ncbi:LysR family transcriptional regulator [Ramlibacter tataouinensis]|uniref:LysR family transcriptional regulator n=1 Tax=Ramlibacter tataouinensis TaxID=94132 RepID=UPI0022F3D99F|nr:LysR family transcriptional regulator [Ramlibacter tataouinensis]WBY02850.1 LysR family transcriptional regulator [Ramlibacter tataouinensis]
MRYDPISLRLFVAVAQTGSISAAAERMNIALAAASRRIVQLEADVGLPLLDRRPRGVTLTAAGAALLRHAHEIQGAFDRMHWDMSEHACGARGAVRIMANSSSVLQFLPEDLPAFLSVHRDLRIDLTERPSGEVLRSVQDGTTEVGVFHARSPEVPANLAVAPYRRDELVLLVPASWPLPRRKKIGFEQVLDQEFVAFPPGTALRTVLVTAANAHGSPLKVSIQVRGFEALVRMVAARLGVGVLPRAAMARPVHAGVRVLALQDAWAQRQHFVVHRPFEVLSPPAQLLAAFLAARGEP